MQTLSKLLDQATLRTTEYIWKMTRYCNQRIKTKKFEKGDLVLRKIMPNTKDMADGPLGPNWEGPLIIHDIIPPRTYILKRPENNIIPWIWNVEHLRHYLGMELLHK